MNDTLYRWKLKDTNICNFCNLEKQTITHPMRNCQITSKIWEDLKELFDIPNTNWSNEQIMTNKIHQNVKHVINFIALIVKQFIFRSFCREEIITLNKVIFEILGYQRTDKYKLKCKTESYDSKWDPVEDALSMFSVPEYV